MIRPDARILRDTAALSLASLTIGTSFGVLATSAGIEPVMACVMSLAVFAGGAQFLMVAGVESGALWASVAAALLLNARHLPFAMALAPFMGRTRARRAVESHLIVDESAAYALAQPDARSAEHGFLTVGVALFCCWNIGTAFGVLAGSALGDPKALGLDAAFPASLLALLMPQLRRPPARAAAAAGAALALAATPLLPAGGPVLLAGFGALAGLWVEARRGEEAQP